MLLNTSNPIVIFCMAVLMIGVANIGSAQNTNESVEMQIERELEGEVIIISTTRSLSGSFIDYKLYEDHAVADLVTRGRGRGNRGEKFHALTDAISAALSPIELVYIDSNDALLQLPMDDRMTLKEMYLIGTAIASIAYDPLALKQELGIEHDVAMIDDNRLKMVAVQYDPVSGQVHEFTRELDESDRTDSVAIGKLLDWVKHELTNGTGSQLQAKDTATDLSWQTCATTRYSGTMSGGDWIMDLIVSQLGTIDGWDYWSIEPQLTHEITSGQYSCSGTNSFDCGWYKDYMSVKVQITDSDGEIWEAMPNSTIGSTTTSQTIGASLTSSQIGVNGSITHAYSTSDMTVYNLSNVLNNIGEWKFDYNGPDYGGVPFSKNEPGNVAKTGSFAQTPTVIARIPSGGFYNISYKVTPNFRNEKDTNVRLVFPADIRWTNNAGWGGGSSYQAWLYPSLCQ